MPELADAVVGVARYVFDHSGRLEQDMAAAREAFSAAHSYAPSAKSCLQHRCCAKR